MAYAVKEIYLTIQGEGIHAGRAAVFCRFAGCNLWSGVEADRASAVCSFCDTDFVGIDGPGGGKFSTAIFLADAIEEKWLDTEHDPFVVLTGGEPALQVDDELIRELKSRNFTVAIETNGSQPIPAGIDWICVSPKPGVKLNVTKGDELKLVFPQDDALPEMFERFDFEHFLLQPMDGPKLDANRRAAFEYCRKHPKWRVSLQIHKVLGVR